MELRQLQHFLAVYRCGNFVSAAADCFITSQGIASSVNRLEAELGFKLFVRSKAGMTPTRHGELLLPRAKQILEAEQECRNFFAQERRSRCVVSAMFVRGTMEDIVYPAVSRFRSKCPDYSLRINVSSDLNCEAAVLSGECDLALCAGPIAARQLDCRHLCTKRNVFVANRSHPLAGKAMLSVSDLRGVPVAVENESTRSTQALLRLCRQAGFPLTVESFVNDPKLTVYLAEIGQCCGIMNEISAAKECPETLCLIPFDTPELDWDIYLIRKKDSILSSAVRDFERILLQHAPPQP